jgi:HJR/Mrr/RecB family endonuclease
MMLDFTSGHGVPDEEGEVLIEDSLLHLLDNPGGVSDDGIGDWLANDIARRARHYAQYLAPLSPDDRAAIRREVYHLSLSDIRRLQASLEIAPKSSPIITLGDTIVSRLKGQPEDLLTISPRELETVVAELLTDMGAVVRLTPMTRDGGYDMAAYLPSPIGELLCLVEVKRNARHRPVSVAVVRALHGVVTDRDASVGMIVTTSYFSPEAQMHQSRHAARLRLSDYHDVLNWISEFPRRRSGAT